jgi:hypothetical protein
VWTSESRFDHNHAASLTGVAARRYSINPHQVVYRRTELYVQVWAAPMLEVAKKYDVSDVALAKTCKKLGVPVPGRGHWARVAAGRAIKTPMATG